MSLYGELVGAQTSLRRKYMEEIEKIASQDEHAASGKEDHTSAVHRTLKTIAETDALKDIVRDFQAIRDLEAN